MTCVNQAVAGKHGLRTLRLDFTDSGSHSLIFGSSDSTVEVECCTLEDIFQRFSLTKVDYLKMDCEGAESEILENPIPRLQQIGRISMGTPTIVGWKADDLAKLLRGIGFDVRLFESSRLCVTRLS